MKDGSETTLTRPLSAAEISAARARGLALSGAAEAAERAAIAAALDLISLDALSYEARLAPDQGDGWRLEGVLRADLAQRCVVSLEPAPERIEEPFERLWRPAATLAAAENAADAGDLEEDWAAAQTLESLPEIEPTPDPIDLGPVLLETLALALAPYPRAPGARFDGLNHGPPGAAPLTDETAKPFAALEALRARESAGNGAPEPHAAPRNGASPREDDEA